MTTSSRLGASFETSVRDYLRARGFSCYRLAMGGTRDEGDLVVMAGGLEWSLELKNAAKIDLAGGTAEAAKQAHGRPYALVVKRRSCGPGDAYVVMPLKEWVALIGPPAERS